MSERLGFPDGCPPKQHASNTVESAKVLFCCRSQDLSQNISETVLAIRCSNSTKCRSALPNKKTVGSAATSWKLRWRSRRLGQMENNQLQQSSAGGMMGESDQEQEAGTPNGGVGREVEDATSQMPVKIGENKK